MVYDCDDDEDAEGNVIVKFICWGNHKKKLATFDKNGIQCGGFKQKGSNIYEGWSNQLALTYEIGFHQMFGVGGVNKRAMGCPGTDGDFKDFPFLKEEDASNSDGTRCSRVAI